MAGLGIPNTGIRTARPTRGMSPAVTMRNHALIVAARDRAPRTFSTSQAEACSTCISSQPQAGEFLNQREIGLHGCDGLAALVNSSGMHMAQIRSQPQVLHLFR